MEKIGVGTLILALYVLPVMSVYFNLVPTRFRFRIFYLPFFAISIFVLMGGWSWEKLGIRVDNIQEAFIPYLILTLGGSFFIWAVAKILGKKRAENWWRQEHFQYKFAAVSVFQEYFYRATLVPLLFVLFDSFWLVVITNTALFALLHIIYPNVKLNLFISSIAGVAFCAIYIMLPNLILLSLSHCILNFLAVLYNLVGLSADA